jgi:hypothetical protein
VRSGSASVISSRVLRTSRSVHVCLQRAEASPASFLQVSFATYQVSFCHIARCVCRRAERCVLRLNEEQPINELIYIYLNRQSTLAERGKNIHSMKIMWRKICLEIRHIVLKKFKIKSFYVKFRLSITRRAFPIKVRSTPLTGNTVT